MAHDGHGHGPVDDPNFVNDRSYETRDVSMSTILKWIFFMFVFVNIAAGITYGIFRFLVPGNDERTTAFPLPTVRAVPPEPRLQANPVLEIKDYRDRENYALTHYGKDPKTGELHIPVDRAIDLVLEEGLPTRPDPGKKDEQEPNEPSNTQGQAPPGEPNTLPQRRTPENPISPPPAGATGMGAQPAPNAPSNPGPPRIPTDINSTGGGQPAGPAGNHMNSGGSQ